ncbi:hypothetical protein OCGS_0281 [Oceaniovalibus guishaninsula JLT2003]|uniref:STAS/SEC14 domain-containing protein n=1 Tax=Oceaniovalibus guishaninsula JLT2003 TaxID=1231392 RepID=K2HSS4_9RHOB|nr:STAS/SEC14 domain-containing protein [Oceaniovalibus guishaninsula]EKE45664.1 hypothetical protein OCGS_0281 [Oceaniovalibus guishaninsula JLT2003]
MLKSASIEQTPTTRPDVFAFRIHGQVTQPDMEALGAYMNEVFDRFDKVSMLLIFDGYEGSETGASSGWESIKSRVRSPAKLDRYAHLGASKATERMVGALGAMLPVEAKGFDRADEDAAWAFVGARPA